MPVSLTTLGQYAIPYFEEAEGWRERWTRDGVELTRSLRVYWGDRDYFLRDMLGYSVYSVADGKIQRFTPEPHPYQSSLYASSADLKRIVGVPGQDSTGRHTIEARAADGSVADPGTGGGFAVYDVNYKRYDYEIKSDDQITSELQRYITKDPKFGIESLSIPGQTLKWGVFDATGQPAGPAIPASIAGKPIPQPTSRLYPTAPITYIWREVPYLQLTKLLAAQGKINASLFDDGTNFMPSGFPAETLLLNQIEARRVQHPVATVYWEIMFNFIYRPTGWRKLMAPVLGKFYKVVAKDTGGLDLFETTDFDDLFDLSS